MEDQLDISAKSPVEVEIRADGTVLWVHHQGISVLRVCRISDLRITDHRGGKYSKNELLRAAGQHINVARDAVVAMTDSEGELLRDYDRLERLHNVLVHALDEAIAQVPLELVPNPRPITKFS